jgi:hypothetical protein
MLHPGLGELLLNARLPGSAGRFDGRHPAWGGGHRRILGEQLQALRRESISVNIDVCRIRFR